jgi:phosphatidylinositol 3-kinase
VEADPNPETTTPSEVPMDKDEMGRLERLIKDYERGDVVKVDWLDRIAFRQIERAHATEASKSEHLFLYIDLPRFDFPVVFSETEGQIPYPPAPVPHPPQAHQQNTPAPPQNFLGSDKNLWKLYDPDSWKDNPVEIKHRKLLRSHRLGDEGRDLKPGPADRDRLNVGSLALFFPADSLGNL